MTEITDSVWIQVGNVYAEVDIKAKPKGTNLSVDVSASEMAEVVDDISEAVEEIGDD